MLLLMMELKGRFNSKVIKKAAFGDTYFDEMGGFESVEKDRITGNVSSPSGLGRNGQLMNVLGCRKEGSHLQADAGFTGSTDAACIGEDEG